MTNKMPAIAPSEAGVSRPPLSMMEIMSLDSVAEKIFNHNVAVGWWKEDHEIGTKIALIHSETSEALEGFRKNKKDDHLPHHDNAAVELADTVIRCFDLAKRMGYPIGAIISEKIIYNMQRQDHKLENREKVGGKEF